MSLLTLNDVGYGIRGKALLEGANITLRPGELTVAIGPNGAGKSTLLRLCCGELSPTSGRVLWNGVDLASVPAWRLAASRAVLPQASSLGFPFMVGEVVRLGMETVGRKLSRHVIAGIIQESLTSADVHHLPDRSYETLSGGERQRVHFARAIAQLAAGRAASQKGSASGAAPLAQALFLDEPTASLDIHHQLLLIREARRLADRGIAVFAVLHDLGLAAACADHVVLLSQGKIVAQGAPVEVLTPTWVRDVFGVETEILQGQKGHPAFAYHLP